MKKSDRAARQNARATARTDNSGAVATCQTGSFSLAEREWRSPRLRNSKIPLAQRALRSTREEPAEDSNLGASLEALGRNDEAEAAYRRAIALDPGLAVAHHNLGNLLHKQRRNAESEAAFRAALRARQDYANAWNGLGHSLQCQGRLKEALDAFRHAVRYGPSNIAAHCNLGTLLFALDCNAEALEALRRALVLDPGYAPAHGNLGALLVRSGYPIAAESASRTAIALAPNQHRWLTNLGVALLSQGRHAEAEDCYRKALSMQPDYASGHGNLLFALNYRTDVTADEIFAEYQDWDSRHAKHLAAETRPFTLDRTPGRRLRVGYVSADFRQHAVAMFAEPLIAAHDRSNVELYLYAGVAAEDAATERFRSLSDRLVARGRRWTLTI